MKPEICVHQPKTYRKKLKHLGSNHEYNFSFCGKNVQLYMKPSNLFVRHFTNYFQKY